MQLVPDEVNRLAGVAFNFQENPGTRYGLGSGYRGILHLIEDDGRRFGFRSCASESFELEAYATSWKRKPRSATFTDAGFSQTTSRSLTFRLRA